MDCSSASSLPGDSPNPALFLVHFYSQSSQCPFLNCHLIAYRWANFPPSPPLGQSPQHKYLPSKNLFILFFNPNLKGEKSLILPWDIHTFNCYWPRVEKASGVTEHVNKTWISSQCLVTPTWPRRAESCQCHHTAKDNQQARSWESLQSRRTRN